MTLQRVLGIGFLLMVAVPVFAQPPSNEKKSKTPALLNGESSNTDLAAIRQTALDFQSAFNSGNARDVASCWTVDGDYVDEDGQVFSGRPAIEKLYGEFFAANKGLHLQIIIDSLRLLSDSAAIEDGRAILDPAPAGAPAISKYTAVHIKVDGKWKMSTVRDSRIEATSSFHKVADLEWLIGTWVAEEHGAKTESVCRWVANKSFVQRTYTVTKPDHTTASGIQIIGFNPQGDYVQSWNFSSDGGIAVGIWSPKENGWSAEIRGTQGDGQSITAVNTLTRLDDNAYAWQSVQRTVGGESLPDTDEVVLKRQSQ